MSVLTQAKQKAEFPFKIVVKYAENTDIEQSGWAAEK